MKGFNTRPKCKSEFICKVNYRSGSARLGPGMKYRVSVSNWLENLGRISEGVVCHIARAAAVTPFCS